ncbi:hypothetical protein SELMODRAFT_121407 [Selaginella moellendorffii]|uniref:phosphoribosylaminoimidazole carboxylase n=1 Tax=Selaginella moellendorffii TaxID=88036 RepID=D8SNZ6_SELML|nr:hypothetical protein SELMODRAFT_121407 [Selaginella moellendorffii]
MRSQDGDLAHWETVVGILGGGQLGRMLCQAASTMGLKVAVLDPAEDCPASRLAHKHHVGSFRDRDAVREFAKSCGVLTVEIEHVDVDTIDALATEGIDVEPSPQTIRIIQDKYLQKVHFQKHGIPLPDFLELKSIESVEEASSLFGYPLMVKSRRLAYDGRGNAVVRSRDDFESAVASLGGFEHGLYAERWAPFVKELAVMVARSRSGELRCYPVVETSQKDNICHVVEAPAQVSNAVAQRALDIARKTIGSLEGAGIYGVELFLLADGQVLLNEVAPRPHNSGHYTIEACYVSQFEQHLRAVLGFPLGDTAMKVPAAMMYNLLGEAEGDAGFNQAYQTLRRALNVPGASIHWYNKAEIRRQRKMGHITVAGDSAALVRARMNQIISSTSFALHDLTFSFPGPLVGIYMGSDSDLRVMKDAADVLDSFGVAYEMTIVSAHRTTERMNAFSRTAHERGIKVIIAGAGGAAHLPGMIASATPLPVIGVPINVTSFDGLDALLSIVQMPKGVPVATVAVDNATNGGLLAVRMLALTNPKLLQRMITYQQEMEAAVLEKAEKLEKEGWRNYYSRKNKSSPS